MSNVAYTTSNITNFSPSSIANCALWLDSSDATTITFLSGSSVNTWRDKSASAITMSQATLANAPTITATLNGRNVMGFTTAQNMTSTANLTLNGTQSIFVVVNALTTTNYFFFEHGPNTNTTDGNYFYGNNGAYFGVKRPSAIRLVSVPPTYNVSPFSINTWYVLGFVNSNVTTNTNDLYGSINGAYQPLVYANPSQIGQATGTTANLFYLNPSARVPASNYYAEILVYNAALTPGQAQQVEGYLAWKWGLQGSFPTGHPYKSIPTFTLTSTNQFNPLYFGNLQVWFDAADPNNNGTVPANASIVSTWSDKSGNARNATQATVGSQPTYATNIQNGLGGIVFNGTNSCLNIPSFTTVPYTIFMVCRFLTTGNTGFALNYLGTGGVNPTWRNLLDATDGGGQTIGVDYGGSIQRYRPTTSTNDTNTHILSLSLPSAAKGDFYFDGTLGINTTGFTQTASAITGTTLGAYQQIPTNSPMNGYVFEVIWYSVQLSLTQIQQTEGYLAWKWGLQGRLPSTHPYSQQNVYFFSPTISQFTLPRSIRPAFFTPLSVLGSIVWLDPADPATVGLSGTTISSVLDKSASPVTFNVGANKPLNTNPINGLTTMNFATGGNLSANNATKFNSISQFSMFLVNRPTWSSGSLGYAPCMFSIRDATTTCFSWHIQPGYANTTGWNGTATSDSGTVIAQNELNIFEIIQGASSYTVFKNGNQGNSPSYTITGRTGLPANVAASSSAAAEPFIGQIAEVLLYSRTLTNIERQSVEGYLAWKWGLQNSLSAGHPFQLFPPPP